MTDHRTSLGPATPDAPIEPDAGAAVAVPLRERLEAVDEAILDLLGERMDLCLRIAAETSAGDRTHRPAPTGRRRPRRHRPMRMLLIDNFDSFTLNIAQLLYEVTGTPPVVLPHDVPYADLPLDDVQAIVISPGPGRPSQAADFGVCQEVIARCQLPILGVCLGHQGIAEFFGGRTVRAPDPAHGVLDTIKHTGTGLFAGLPQDLQVVRYHSLIAVDVPDALEVTAWTHDGLVMALAHRSLPLWGVQFHPESIETRGGHRILANFGELATRHHLGLSLQSMGGDEPVVSLTAAAFEQVGGARQLRLRLRPLVGAGGLPEPPEELFRARYAGRPHAFWLDAEGSERPTSRYSVMGAAGDPGSVVLTYRLADRRLTLAGTAGEAVVHGDVFTLLEELLDGVQVDTPQDCPVPFQGGLVGYLGYELKALTSGAERHRSPVPDAWFVHTREFVVYDHETGRAYECHLAAAQAGTARVGPDAATGRSAPTMPADDLSSSAPGAVLADDLQLRDDHDAYVAKIRRAQHLITEGETYEVCLTNTAYLADVDDGLRAYGLMRRVSPVPYGAYLRCGDVEVLSSSPETFLRVDAHRMVESRPIKGTRPRGRTPAEDAALRHELATSAKDRAENLMIVDLVRHDLNAVCEPGSVHVPAAFVVESYSSVHQLVSTVRGRLPRSASGLTAVRACFPGGSMTGAPKKRTMAIIDELEGAARGVYAGSLGWLSFTGELNLSIVIRTAVVRDRVATIGIGGAITARSDAEDEFSETLVKASVPYAGLRGGE